MVSEKPRFSHREVGFRFWLIPIRYLKFGNHVFSIPMLLKRGNVFRTV